MRSLPAVVLLGAHVAVLVAWRSTLFPNEPSPALPRPRVAATRRVAPALAPVRAPHSLALDSLSIADIEELGQQVEDLQLAVQQDEQDVEAMKQLAELYMRLGSYGDAIGPLARAVELEPQRGDLWMALGRALERSGRTPDTTDLAAAAREFTEMIALAGHGC